MVPLNRLVSFVQASLPDLRERADWELDQVAIMDVGTVEEHAHRSTHRSVATFNERG